MNTPFFTGNGDNGECTVGSTKISKDNPVIQLLGAIDELNSTLGWCRSEAERDANINGHDKIAISQTLLETQEMLFVAQAEFGAIAFKQEVKNSIVHAHTEKLEKIVFKIDETLPPLKKFIIPGGSELSARIDIARSFARRVERIAVATAKELNISISMLQFLNRLSGMLFALARYSNFINEVEEKNPSY
jgi:cob(I)alamin adenosyltransferase